MAYVDLNPVRAKIVKHAVDASHTSAAKRLEEYLGPIVAGTRSHAEKKKDKQPDFFNITIRGYFDYLALYSTESTTETDKQARWIEKWAIRNGWSRIGVARS
ncbi:MAG: hypothetical protein ACJAVI_006032 [Candidatus Azotimanducaceae bacterium]|jgi:hypothetical protein